MVKKERLDVLLVEKKLIASREKAKAYIMANMVKVDGVIINKAGTRCDVESQLTVEKDNCRFVSRGGNKLEKAITEFNIEINGKIVADIGASTGGFTDCLLQYGAKKVYCIDVGYGQLDWTLRNDPRIVNLEKTNIRFIDTARFSLLFDLATIDVSFISLGKVFPVLIHLLKDQGEVVALIKPQFEAGRELVKKGGIVDDPEIHKEIIMNIIEMTKNNYKFLNLTFSPIKNTPGNIEYLIYLQKNQNNNPSSTNTDLIREIVNNAHKYFFKRNEL